MRMKNGTLRFIDMEMNPDNFTSILFHAARIAPWSTSLGHSSCPSDFLVTICSQGISAIRLPARPVYCCLVGLALSEVRLVFEAYAQGDRVWKGLTGYYA